MELGDVGQHFKKKQQPGMETQIANVADEIAYNSHDVDDGLRSGLITLEQLQGLRRFHEQYEAVRRAYTDLAPRRITYEVVRRFINAQVTALVEGSRHRLIASAPKAIDAVRALVA